MTADPLGELAANVLEVPTESWRQELRRLGYVVNHLKRLSPASIHYLRDLLNEPGGKFDV